MTTFIVVSNEFSADLQQNIERSYPKNYRINPTTWLLSTEGVTADISKSLGITDGNVGSAVVFRTDGYYGWNDKSLWEWLDTAS